RADSTPPGTHARLDRHAGRPRSRATPNRARSPRSQAPRTLSLASWPRPSSDELLLARPRQRVIEPLPQKREDLVDLIRRHDERRAQRDDVADRAHDEAALLTQLHALRTDGAFGVERRFRGLVLNELAPTDEANAARVTDERMGRKRVQLRLKLGRNVTHVRVQVALLVDLVRAQRHRGADGMARVREPVAEQPHLPARLDHR